MVLETNLENDSVSYCGILTSKQITSFKTEDLSWLHCTNLKENLMTLILILILKIDLNTDLDIDVGIDLDIDLNIDLDIDLENPIDIDVLGAKGLS